MHHQSWVPTQPTALRGSKCPRDYNSPLTRFSAGQGNTRFLAVLNT